ncbi:hypothetical protein L3V83_13735 [Thiotrichales bacterium 19X7-9]|nr:hypothetical protein [Thiotrichales bacterium 19X7-9]
MMYIYNKRKRKLTHMFAARYSYGRLACAALMDRANALDKDTLEIILENDFDIKSLKEKKIWVSDIAKKTELETKEDIIQYYVEDSLLS